MTELGLLDGIGSKSNLIYWSRVLDNIENQIEISKEYEMSLDDALCYPLWLLASSEYIFSLIRRKIAISQDKGKLLDSPYSELVKKSQEFLSLTAHEHVKAFEVIRNTLIHKGFPNTFATPMNKIKDGDKAIYNEIQTLMRTPSFYFHVRSMMDSIKSEIS